MRTTMLKVALAIVPAALVAQTSGQASANANGQASVEIPRSFSAQGRARLEALYERAQNQNVPTAPIAQRVAEGQAKGAAEASILASATRVESNLETAHQVIVSSGRNATPNETMLGANALDRGLSRAQLQTMISHATGNRSLVVALDVVGELTAHGVPASQAVAQVQSRLDAGLPDAAISSLLAITASGTSPAGGSASGSATGSATGSTNGAARGTGGVTGTVTGTVSGVLGRRGGGF